MAQGDVTFFDRWIFDVLQEEHNMETDTIKVALVSNTTVPAANTADPHFGGTGTTNFATNEVSGTGYTAGGETAASPTVTDNSGTIEIDFGNVSWAKQTSGGPANIRWAIIYNDTNTEKPCIGYVELGAADHDLDVGGVSITFATPVATINQA